MTCPSCAPLSLEAATLRQEKLRALAENDALRASHRRTRERLAVLIGRVGVALDYIESERARIESEHG